MVTVHCGSADGVGGLAGSVQPLILSKPLCSAHQAAAASSASARVGAVNSRQYFAFFNTSDGNLSPSHSRGIGSEAASAKSYLPTSTAGSDWFQYSLRTEGEGAMRPGSNHGASLPKVSDESTFHLQCWRSKERLDKCRRSDRVVLQESSPVFPGGDTSSARPSPQLGRALFQGRLSGPPARGHVVVGAIVHADGPAGLKDFKGLFIDGLGATRLRRSPE